jgi:feruloyl-CoA synthase
MLVRSQQTLGPFPRAMTDRLDYWAATAPDRAFLAQRDQSGNWCEITYEEVRARARSIAQAILNRGLTPERPVVVLSGNSVEHALIGLGAMYAGVPFASISVAYSLIAGDFDKLRSILDQLTPGLVFVTNGAQFASAIEAAVPIATEVVVLNAPLPSRRCAMLEEIWSTRAGPAVDAAHAKVGPDTIAKIIFTSGTAGLPKGVINTQQMMTSNQAMIDAAFPSFGATPPILLDWLPWSHTFGANHNFNLALMHGGTFYIDEGKPVPGAIEETVRNLREVSPTVYFNVPKGYEMLLPYLRTEPALRRSLFNRLQCLFFAGATLPGHVSAELERLGQAATGERIPMVTGLGSTETAPSAFCVTQRSLAPGSIGIPNAGVTLKLVPNAGKLEARLKGPLITPGYWRRPDLTAKAFDDEGFFLLGDALKFADPVDPERGLLFDGRIAEDFKLSSGTWVSVGPLKARFVMHFAPYVRELVVAGHDRDEATGLVIPDVEACRTLANELPETAPAADVLGHPRVRETFSTRLGSFNKSSAGSSTRVRRILLMADLPSIDLGELTDKGSINQRVVLSNRADLVGELYAEPLSSRIIT